MESINLEVWLQIATPLYQSQMNKNGIFGFIYSTFYITLFTQNFQILYILACEFRLNSIQSSTNRPAKEVTWYVWMDPSDKKHWSICFMFSILLIPQIYISLCKTMAIFPEYSLLVKPNLPWTVCKWSWGALHHTWTSLGMALHLDKFEFPNGNMSHSISAAGAWLSQKCTTFNESYNGLHRMANHVNKWDFASVSTICLCCF